MGHEKLTVSFFSYQCYTVAMETSRMKYGTKNTKESNKDCKSYGTIDLSFKLKLIVFFISQFYASNCFDIINSFSSTGMLTN